MSRVLAGLRALATLGTVGLAVSLLVPLCFLARGQQLMVVSSDAMAPGLTVGDVAVLQRRISPSDLHAGVLVAFRPPGGDRLVTHRVVSAQVVPRTTTDPTTGEVRVLQDGFGRPVLGSWLVTKGDANPAPDPDAVDVLAVRGAVVGVGHGWGPALEALTSTAGRAACAVPALLALGALEVLDRRAPTRRTRAA